jgi:endonuclease YncB( thermonuclease family)
MIIKLLAACLSLYIYDGDNVRCDGVTYRVVGLNAPEIRAQCPFERELAVEARDLLRYLVSRDGAVLEEVLCHGSNFGRKCAVVRSGGKTAAEELVSKGLAEPYWCGSGGCPRRRNWCMTRRLT